MPTDEGSIPLLKRLVEEGEKFTFENFCHPNKDYPGEFCGDSKPEWLDWIKRSKNLVWELMEESSPPIELLLEAGKIQTEGNRPEHFDITKEKFLSALRLTLSALEDTSGKPRGLKTADNPPALPNKVFVVHDHDQALKADVEKFLRQIGLKPVMLRRQPDKGQAIIKKFEENKDAGYAFILLTPDEVANTVDQEKVADASRKKESPASPNAIFEFGFLVGKLGRKRVCCIYKEGVVLPSDLTGLIYKKVSDSIESQAYSIIKDLKAAGYKIKI